ncbi:MAG TPA: (d)CMP kinase [Williamwhitmania sp.]|nr:(d)CMP kinase [Williamwhitmania sp.]
MLSTKITIAIDGYSSCGKSTFAKAIAKEFGYIYIDSGAMYRAVTLAAIRGGAVTEDGKLSKTKVLEMLPSLQIGFVFNASAGRFETMLNGEVIEDAIRTIEVSNLVSPVSAIAEVRTKMVALQQEMGKSKGIVMDGRDIGTVVFPHAELKIFMTADPKVRAMRRYKELQEKCQSVSLEEIEANVRNRDHMDQNREVSPLRKADDALVLDNSYMTPAEQMEWVRTIVEKL